MKIMKPLILISNDDGYHAKGLNSLIDMLSDMGEILVCAPESARSGFATAFSATTPLRLKLRRKREGVEVWSCNGTPVDCVKLALSQLCTRRADRLCEAGFSYGARPQARLGGRRHQPRRQRLCQFSLFWHYGRYARGLHEVYSFCCVLSL